ncbi:MAG: hypothetical protein QOK24_748 [Verrucomicrobiota bacterium]|jgi:hypothetical protein
MRLFISYASEDRADFVEPLAKQLAESYDVWFAPYELKVGQSLLAQIDAGLRECDYGVVILSHDFFRKKWPPAELGGLFALEEPSRKIILPVWRGLTEADVKNYSPILADRYAANGSDSVEAVVAALRFAIDAADRQRKLGPVESALQRFKLLAETIKEAREGSELLQSEQGATLVATAAQCVYDIVEQAFSELNAASKGLQFTAKRHAMNGLVIHAPYRLGFHLYLRNSYINTATTAILTILTTKGTSDFIDNEFDMLGKQEFKPSFGKGRTVMWRQEGGPSAVSTEELAAQALEQFQAQLARLALPR